MNQGEMNTASELHDGVFLALALPGLPITRIMRDGYGGSSTAEFRRGGVISGEYGLVILLILLTHVGACLHALHSFLADSLALLRVEEGGIECGLKRWLFIL